MLQLGTQGQPDFTQPLEMMMDCHRRIEKFLGVLVTVVKSADGGPLDDEHHGALDTALNYFRQAAPRHTEDEEKSLFPRLRALHDPRADQVLSHIQSLESDHRRAELAHARVDALGMRWLDENILAPDETAELRVLLAELQQAYTGHIRQEDTQLFPLADQLLSACQLSAIGREMQQRRLADPGRPGSRCAARRSALQKEATQHAIG